jgi:hypothetical protein
MPGIKDERLPLRRTVKDSVFTDLFSDRRYTLELYRALHPEDRDAGVDDVEIVTVQNVMTSDQHNDLGFVVGDRLLVLVEAQSTWSPNIVLRSLLYAAQTLKNYVLERRLDVYGAAPVEVPLPELYVVYTGGRADVPAELTLSGTLFGGRCSGLEARVGVIKDAGPTLPGQYIDFARTVDAYRAELGPNEDAVRSAIADCVGRGVLADYLKDREKEVVGIMMTLYDEREVLRNHIAAERRAAAAEGRAEGRAEGEARGRAEGEARGVVAMCKEFGLTAAAAAAKVAERLGIGLPEAEALTKTLW